MEVKNNACCTVTGNYIHQKSHQMSIPHRFPNDHYARRISIDPSNFEIDILFAIAGIGIIANLSVIVAIFSLQNLRNVSNAFICHHCVLDLIKSGYCIPFARTMTRIQPISYCSLIGSSYIVFVTTTAFNQLALVVNESYMFSDLVLGIQDSRNYCCVIFGIFIIWFGSITMNLGVAFIPGSPNFDHKDNFCIFTYGITKNYILHILWVILVSMAILLTIKQLRKLYIDIKRASFYRLSTLIRTTLQMETTEMSNMQQLKHDAQQRQNIKRMQKATRNKVVLFILLLLFFVLFWYPLFLLSATDPHFKRSPLVYKSLTIYAWSNPVIPPFIFLNYLKITGFCKRDQNRESMHKHALNLNDRGKKFLHRSNSSLEMQNVTDTVI